MRWPPGGFRSPFRRQAELERAGAVLDL